VNVFDEGKNVGHDYSGILPKSNVEIPFLLWFSSQYKSLSPQKINAVKQNIHKPYVSDDLFHAIIDISCVNTSVFDKKRSIFAKNFDTSRSRILEDGKNYDLK